MNNISLSALSKDEIDHIYQNISYSNNESFMERYGQQIKDFVLPDGVKAKILDQAKNFFEVDDLELIAYQFARYENTVGPSGDTSKPVLYPHFDTFEEQRFTFDLQLSSNTDWPLVLEGSRFLLKDGDALMFSGTHEIHWREKKEFNPGEYVDMLFCHLNRSNPKKLDDDHKKNMLAKEAEYAIQYNKD